MIPPYIDAMRGVNVPSVARALGLAVAVSRGTASPAHFGCVACGAERRHTKSADRRGACGVAADGLHWRCYQCDAYGDALDLVRHVEGREGARPWCERWLVLPSTARAPVAALAPTTAPVLPSPPDPGEIRRLFDACRPVTDARDVAAYLARRGVDPVTVEDLRLAVALPDGLELPRWARWRGHGWSALGHRLLVPLFDAAGELRSVIARRIGDGASPKALPPAGFGRAGLIMACPLARELLRRGGRPAWWDDRERMRVIVTEGDSDFLTVATGPVVGVRWTETEHAPAVFGITSGAFTAAIGARLPNGVEVVIATDTDEAGDRYAQAIGRALEHRVRSGTATLVRWTVRT